MILGLGLRSHTYFSGRRRICTCMHGAAFALLLACHRPPSNHAADAFRARKDLAELRIEYSEQSFMERIRAKDRIAVDLFLQAGMSPDTADGEGMPAWRSAADSGDMGTVQLLLKAGVDPYRETAPHFNLVTYSLTSENIPLIRSLIEHKVDWLRPSPLGNSPFHFAVRSGKVKAVGEILSAGVSPEATSADGETTIFLAAQSGYHDMVNLILTSLSHRDISGGQAQASGPQDSSRPTHPHVNMSDSRGFTPLHIAASQGHESNVLALLSAGATVDARNEQGRTPLHIAAEGGHQTVVAALLNAGADPLRKSAGGVSPYQLALTAQHAAVLQQFAPATRTACDAGHWEWCFAVGDEELSSQQPESAYRNFLKACEGGFAQACWSAGRLASQFGDLHQMERLQRLGCNQDFGKSCNSLAVILGKRGKIQEALESYRKACELRHSVGCHNLGVYHSQNKKRDIAADYFKKACDLGKADSCAAAGRHTMPVAELLARVENGLMTPPNDLSQAAIESFRDDLRHVSLSGTPPVTARVPELQRQAEQLGRDIEWQDRTREAFRVRSAAEAGQEWLSFTQQEEAQVNAVTTWSCVFQRTQVMVVGGKKALQTLCMITVPSGDKRIVWIDGGPDPQRPGLYGKKVQDLWLMMKDSLHPGATLQFTGQFKGLIGGSGVGFKPLRISLLGE